MSPRLRVITDNDYSGDPDGLVQLAHLLLSPSVDVRAVLGSHLRRLLRLRGRLSARNGGERVRHRGSVRGVPGASELFGRSVFRR